MAAAFGKFITAAEVFHAKKDPKLSTSLHKATGRAGGPTFAIKPLVPSCPKVVLPVQASSPQLRWWGTLTSLLGMLSTLLFKEKCQQCLDIGATIRTMSASVPDIAHRIGVDMPSSSQWRLWMLDIMDHNHLLVSTWYGHAKAVHGRLRYTVLNEATAQLSAWILSEFEGRHCRALFKWTKGFSRPLATSAKGIWRAGIIDEPMDLADHRAMEWQEHWCRNPATVLVSLSRVQDVRAIAKKEDFQPYSVQHLDDAVCTFNDNTALGADQVGPRFVKNLPLEGRIMLVDLLNSCIANVVWPWQLMLNIMVLLPKDLGGERPIALANFLVRLCLRMMRATSQKWCAKWAGHWDHAIASSSALRSAVLQAFMVESANVQGFDWMLILFDLAKFYDTVELPAIMADGLRLQFPTRTLALIIMNYMAPRVIKSGGCFSAWIQPISSILAGCQDANNMGRISLYRVLDKMHELSPKAPLTTFVDDVKLYCEGTKDFIMEQAIPAVKFFVASILNLKFVFSAKSVILASCPRLAHAAVSAAAEHGVSIKKALKAVDLGVDISVGKRRSIAKFRQRQAAANARNKRVARLGRRTIKAKIYLQAVVPQRTYGFEVVGISPTSVASISAAHAVHLGSKPGCCSTTVVALESTLGDPGVSLYQRKFLHHIAFWLREGHLRRRLATTWDHFRGLFQGSQAKQRWRFVNGPTASTVAMLIDIGWQPIASDHWIGPDGQAWSLTEQPGDLRDFVAAVVNSVLSNRWRRASSHRFGAGLADVPDLHVPKKFLAMLRRQGRHQEARLLVLIMAAGLWTNSRAVEAGYLTSKLCPLCGVFDDHEQHRVYGTCATILQAGLPGIVSTQHLVQHADCESARGQTIWLRGLPPRLDLSASPPPRDLITHQYGELASFEGKLDVTGHDIYLDESGGANARDRRLRRCGWGLSILKATHQDPDLPPVLDLLWGMAGNLPGDIQSPPRACLQAMIQALTITTGDITVKPDAAYLVDGFQAGRHLRPEGLNADLWHQIGILVKGRGHEVRVLKVDAHLDHSKVIDGAVDIQDYHGNSLADALAAVGASISAMPWHLTESQKAADSRSHLILRRLLAAHFHFVKEVPRRAGIHRPKRVKGARSAFQMLMKNSGHSFPLARVPRALRSMPHRVSCSTCNQGSSRKTLKAWLKRPCQGAAIPSVSHGADICRAPSHVQVRVGRADLDRSHMLLHRCGLWWCSTCGAYTTVGGARSSAKLLRQPCKGRAVRGTAGHDYLTRIGLGKMPKSGQRWPQPGHVGNFMADPFNAIPLTALRGTKTTLRLQDIPPAEDLPPCVQEDDEGHQSEEDLDFEDEPDPFDLGHQGFDEP